MTSQGFAIESGNKSPWDRASDEDYVSSLDEPEDFPFSTEVEQVLADISDIIDCLFRLSRDITNPVPHDQIMLSPELTTPERESLDIRYIRENYKVSEKIAERLGKANSQRRAYFKYRRLKYDESGTDHVAGNNQKQTYHYAPVSIVASTVAGQLKEHDSEGGRISREKPKSRSDIRDLSAGESSERSKSENLAASTCPFCWTVVYISGPAEWK
jgi:hypothetical protein